MSHNLQRFKPAETDLFLVLGSSLALVSNWFAGIELGDFLSWFIVHLSVGVGLRLQSQHPLMVLQHLGRQTLDDPVVHQSFNRLHPLSRIPLETALDEAQERGRSTAEDTLKLLG